MSGDEPYEVLYRRFRPARFEDVIGQEHVTSPLRHAVLENKVAHAYLFCGQRGCGKTTTARILAAAVNCESLSESGEPCGKCVYCDGVISGVGGLSVHELDAASNRSIDAVRNIIEQAQVSTAARFKIFVIDEVHRLTPDAASALLKTLEEPPPNVIFILATTDPDKLLSTIRSRTTIFRFRTLEPETMEGLVRDVAERAGITLDDEAVESVIAEGRGSPRDTLSVLERAASGAHVSTSTLTSTLSAALAEGSVGSVIGAVATAINEGSDIPSLAGELLGHWRNCLLSLQAPELLRLPPNSLKVVERDAGRLRTPKLIRLITAVADAAGRMHISGDPRLLLETTLIQQLLPETQSGIDGLHERLDRIEQILDQIVKSGVPVQTPRSEIRSEPLPEVAPERVPEASESERAVDDEPAPEESSAGLSKPTNDRFRPPTEILELIREHASRRLQLRLVDAETGWEGEMLFVETEQDLTDKQLDELRALVKDEGLELKHYIK